MSEIPHITKIIVKMINVAILNSSITFKLQIKYS